MNILIIGNGSREHAINWKIKQSKKVKNIFVIPGNPGIEEQNIGKCIDCDITNFDNIYENVLKNKIKSNIHKIQFENFKKHSLKIIEDDYFIIEKITCVKRVGVYIPGGRFVYPSSVFMAIIPAICAGVKEIIVATPYKNSTDELKVALFLAGEKYVLTVGGAQAIGALAFGIENLEKVDMIVDPGNVFVTEAKRQVFGIVDIDMLVGPSDVLVFADRSSNFKWVAYDSMSQAEHDINSKAILIVEKKNIFILDKKKSYISDDLKQQMNFILAEDLNDVILKINNFAPEHLEIAINDETK